LNALGQSRQTPPRHSPRYAPKKEPAVYPYTTGIAFFVTPNPPLSGGNATTIAREAQFSTQITAHLLSSSPPLLAY
jgi:hypothetical protein